MSQAIRRSGAQAPHLFIVGPCSHGLWTARDLDGSAEGVFRTRKDAIRFALVEGGHDNVVTLSTEPIEPSFMRGTS
ncbi:RAG2 PHD domain containing protein [Phreatobacter stygius]|uniref:RAG2 PHD domain containing protein n=1 Tax=Phreatobacter stygius TaxID=1940610 RepID=A0A4D7AZG8_9HYPH|nr:RAG2 PHD domain containing protein [Phreatobacter stygius]QCI65741.1 RAG2 PHD domain containing protein [Phreatobacter stygius]